MTERPRRFLRRGENCLEVIMMCELPSNALLADEFLDCFDGFSIGSNGSAMVKSDCECATVVLRYFRITSCTEVRVGGMAAILDISSRRMRTFE